jgi:SpoVK/Ycf46/Vps4 family AAA+-type ATPase
MSSKSEENKIITKSSASGDDANANGNANGNANANGNGNANANTVSQPKTLQEYMVEIQKIQSKWVGESEKNLAKVFEEYKQARRHFDKAPILLFNEADAILGKRMSC